MNQPIELTEEQKSKKRRKQMILIALACTIPLILILCCLSIIFIPHAKTPDTTSVVQAQPIQETIPTQAPAPTATPAYTPTATRLPLPSCQQLKTVTDGMTDAQWQAFKQKVKGQVVIDWIGTIDNVSGYSILSGGYPVNVLIDDQGFLERCMIWFIVKTEDRATSFYKGEKIKISGTVYLLADIGGLTIYLDEKSVTITEIQ